MYVLDGAILVSYADEADDWFAFVFNKVNTIAMNLLVIPKWTSKVFIYINIRMMPINYYTIK